MTMMTKSHILEEIRRTARENRGVPLGRQRFYAETGIKEGDWSGRYWARWSDALREAGFLPNRLQTRLDDCLVLEKLALMIRELGRLPVEAELKIRRREDPSVSSNAVGRGERELAIQLPEKATVVHSIKIDDPSGIELYWHRRFDARRKNGEWFELAPEDVVAFKRRRFM